MRYFLPRFSIEIIASLIFSSRLALTQSRSNLRADSISVRVLSIHPNPRDSSDSIVSIQVTVRAADKGLVIPDCAEAAGVGHFFCSAQLKRADGRWIGVRPGSEATPGVEGTENWKSVTLASGTEASFRFSYSTGFMSLRAGEQVRVGFEVWPNAESMQNWKLATTLLTPSFANPARAD